MVFKKGHAPIKKKSNAVKKASKVIKTKSNDVSDFYVKFGIKKDMKTNLTTLSYLISTLKKDLGLVNNFRQKKAFLRKELYETLISLRLGIDSLEKHMPAEEYEALKNKIAEISKYAKKIVAPKPEVKKVEKVIEKPKPVEAIKEAFKKPEPAIEKKSSLIDNASDKERKELEMLRKDLEDISNQLKNKD